MTITAVPESLSIREVEKIARAATVALHRAAATRQARHLEERVIAANLHGSEPAPVLDQLRAYEPGLELVRIALAGTPVEVSFTAGRLHPMHIARPGGELHTWPLRDPAHGVLYPPRISAVLAAQQVRLALRSLRNAAGETEWRPSKPTL